MADSAPCDGCGDPVRDPLTRTVHLNVDGARIDTQRLCPDCFAEWIDRYQREMGATGTRDSDEEGDDIIVD